jgi:LCP family protein required for cell wall assembly
MAATVSTRHPRRRGGSPTIRKVFLVAAGLLSVSLAGGSAFSIGSIRAAERGLSKICAGAGCRGKDAIPDVHPQQCADQVCNFLILGSDSRKGLTKKQQVYYGNESTVPSHRSDTIIVVHVDPVRNRTVVLSIPRDLRVPIPGFGTDKINSAFEHGRNVMVQTVEKLTGLQINHYVEVNFAGFERLVTALGGVRVCVDRPMEDTLADLHLPHAGCYNLKGSQALAFVRARHVEGDVIPDFSRISRQQTFMRALLGKMLSAGAITHLGSIIAAVKGNLVIDKGLDLYGLQDLTRKLSSLGQGGVDFRVVPAAPVSIDGVDYVQVLPSATELFRRVKQGRWLGSLGREAVLTGLSPAAIKVRVYDAGNAGQANRVFTFLQDAGFAVLPLEAAPPGLSTSALLYRKVALEARNVVKAYLPTIDSALRRRYVTDSGADVVVVVAPGFPSIEP